MIPNYYSSGTTLEPKILVVDLEEVGQIFRGHLDTMEHILEDSNSLMNFIMASLTRRGDGVLGLSYDVLDEINNAKDNVYINELTALANVVVWFGEHLFNMFVRLGIYRNGRMFYEFDQWLHNEIVLRKINFQELT
jgi:hypothetical protein